MGIIVLCATALAVVALTQFPSPSDAPVPRAEALVQSDLPTIDTDGPVTLYVIYCSRCHGSPENAYPSSRGHRRNDELKQIIREMAATRAMVSIDEQRVGELFEMHNAMFDRTPYVWIDRSQTDVIAGEVIPGTTVRAGKYLANMDEQHFVLPKTDAKVILTRSRESLAVGAPVK